MRISLLNAYVNFVTGDFLALADSFTDGLWHSVLIDVISGQGGGPGKVSVIVDGRPDVSNRQLSFKTGPDYLIGG